jgi:Polysaccharide biosynthesis protein C-terminal.
VAVDLGNYFKVPADTRDLNYEKYFTKGNRKLKEVGEYTSDNTERLNVEQLKNVC